LKQGKKNKTSFIFIIGMLLLLGFFMINIVSNSIEIKKINDIKQEKNNEYNSIIDENDRLQGILDGDRKEYMERIARDQFGYAGPGEKIFYDITPGSY
jgi:cell division protein FtsB